MSSFDERIKRLESEINALKYGGSFSTSYIALSSQEIDIEQELVGYLSSGVTEVAALKSAIIEIITLDGKTPFTSCYIDPIDEPNVTGRRIKLTPILVNGNLGYKFFITTGSTSDYTTIRGGGTIPPFTIHLTISATSPFTTNLTYQQEH